MYTPRNPATLPIKFVDIETTGLDPYKHEIIEIAVVPLDDNEPFWQTRIKPQRIEDASPKALEVNGYDKHPELWDNAPPIEQVAPVIRAQLAGCLPAGHNVGFDLGFVKKYLKDFDLFHGITYHQVDTVTLAIEHLAPCGLDRVRLEDVCNFLGISNQGAHSALTDALRAKEVYKRLVRSTPVDRLQWWATNKVEHFFSAILDLVSPANK